MPRRNGQSGRHTNQARQVPMDKVERREKAKDRQQKSGYGHVIPFQPDRKEKAKTVTPLNGKQRLLLTAILTKTCVFATGSAGTGKTWLAVATGIKLLMEGAVDYLLFSKPDMPIDGKGLGWLPGGVDEKTALLKRSMREIAIEVLGASHVENLERLGKLRYEPLSEILGLNFHRSYVILDEAQNATPNQMMALLTRSGKDTKVVVCGDYRQQRFLEGKSGLEDAVWRFRYSNYTARIDFVAADIVRSGFCKEAVLAYQDELPEPDMFDEDQTPAYLTQGVPIGECDLVAAE